MQHRHHYDVTEGTATLSLMASSGLSRRRAPASESATLLDDEDPSLPAQYPPSRIQRFEMQTWLDSAHLVNSSASAVQLILFRGPRSFAIPSSSVLA
jgi:hypothetical protein